MLRNKPGSQFRFVGDAAMSVQPHDRVRSPGSSAVACLPAVTVLYFHGRWQAAIRVAGRGAADMTVLQNHIHMSKSGQKGVANAMPGPGSENAILGRRQIVQIHRQTSRLQGDALCSFCFGGEEIRMGMSLRTLEVSGQRNLLS